MGRIKRLIKLLFSNTSKGVYTVTLHTDTDVCTDCGYDWNGKIKIPIGMKAHGYPILCDQCGSEWYLMHFYRHYFTLHRDSPILTTSTKATSSDNCCLEAVGISTLPDGSTVLHCVEHDACIDPTGHVRYDANDWMNALREELGEINNDQNESADANYQPAGTQF